MLYIYFPCIYVHGVRVHVHIHMYVYTMMAVVFFPCACAARVTVLGLSFRPSVRLSVCYHVFCHYVQQGGQKAIPTGSVPHWLDFKKGYFRKSTAFKSYGVKTKRTSQYANEHGLPRPDSARFEHGGGSTRKTKGEYVVLVCQKHYLLT